jgi:hypothetical protein
MLATHKEQIGYDCTIIRVILYSKIFGKCIEKIQDLYNITTITNTLREDVCTSFMTRNLNIILLRMRNISDKSCKENKNTYFKFHNFFFRKSCRLRNIVEICGTSRQATYNNKIRRVRISCWRANATNTLRISNNHCLSTATMVAWTHVGVTL